MTTDSSNTRNRLRIIGGEWRSRLINFADIPDIRPTPDRVRETLFNWLQAPIIGARCLDLFAGSGVLSFEAISRGASSVTALELDPKAASAIRNNVQVLKAEKLQLLQKNTLDWLQTNSTNQQFDVVFVDPPYAAGFYESCCHLLQQNNWLAPSALVYIEADQPLDSLKLPQEWRLIRNKRASTVHYGLCETS
ncbi:MAG: 16S rRNA (guanine(966)-N(2))-methyltransferase RsmD [Pseudomonadota bacterium]